MIELLANFVFILLGAIGLYFGSEWLLEGSSQLAKRFNISPLLVGLTVVSLGTASPEIFVSAYAAFQDSHDIAVGNALGSNIMNIGLVLGCLLFFKKDGMKADNLSFDIIFMFVSSLLFLYTVTFPYLSFLLEGEINRLEGFFLLILVIAYVIVAYIISKRRDKKIVSEKSVLSHNEKSFSVCFFLIILGIVFLAIGADSFVSGSRFYAKEVFGISERGIAVTLVALGTTLPELVTALVALRRGHFDISLGNVIGSHAMHLLVGLGLSALVRPIKIQADFTLDFWMMMLFLFIILVPIVIWNRLSHWMGALLLSLYSIYTLYILYFS